MRSVFLIVTYAYLRLVVIEPVWMFSPTVHVFKVSVNAILRMLLSRGNSMLNLLASSEKRIEIFRGKCSTVDQKIKERDFFFLGDETNNVMAIT